MLFQKGKEWISHTPLFFRSVVSTGINCACKRGAGGELTERKIPDGGKMFMTIKKIAMAFDLI